MRTLALLLGSIPLLACGPGSATDAGTDASAPDAGEPPDLPPSEGTPADMYFAMAVTDDSRNHTGDRLLFLDFADRVRGAFDTTERGNRIVQAPLAPRAITLDGDDSEWEGVPVTIVEARPQSNYPLDVHYDAVPTTIELSAAYDDERIYVRVRWEDPGHTRSDRFRTWTYDADAERWAPAPVAPLQLGAPNEAVVNAAEPLSGYEDQDRVMLMFPVRDPEGWFTDGGLGCAGLCHASLAQSGDPAIQPVGNAAVMHAGLGDGLFDVWQWEAARSAPSGYADDLRISTADEHSASGVAPDPGEAPYEENRDAEDQPAYMHPDGFSQGSVLTLAEAVARAGTPNDGDTIPAVISRTPTGSRADVLSASRYDETTHTWTLELARTRDTGDSADRAFVYGPPATPPADAARELGVSRAGAAAYSASCGGCHGSEAQGVFAPPSWVMPRVQRASSSLIFTALERVPEMRGLPVTEQEVEDIAAFLGNLHTPAP